MNTKWGETKELEGRGETKFSKEKPPAKLPEHPKRPDEQMVSSFNSDRDTPTIIMH